VSLNVFGRTLGPASKNGRQHNPNHQVSLTIGKPFQSAVIGGVQPVDKDYGAASFAAASGEISAGGDVPPSESLASFGKTVLRALGVEDQAIEREVTLGRVVSAALR
jgi:hypothetical protein